eukprot:8734818-Alexandrium_andersonii.AAC.1
MSARPPQSPRRPVAQGVLNNSGPACPRPTIFAPSRPGAPEERNAAGDALSITGSFLWAFSDNSSLTPSFLGRAV